MVAVKYQFDLFSRTTALKTVKNMTSIGSILAAVRHQVRFSSDSIIFLCHFFFADTKLKKCPTHLFCVATSYNGDKAGVATNPTVKLFLRAWNKVMVTPKLVEIYPMIYKADAKLFVLSINFLIQHYILTVCLKRKQWTPCVH